MKTFGFKSIKEVEDFKVKNNGSYIIKRTSKNKEDKFFSNQHPYLDMREMQTEGKFGNDDTLLFSYEEAFNTAKMVENDDEEYFDLLSDGIKEYEQEKINGYFELDEEVLIIIDDRNMSTIALKVLCFYDDVYKYEIGVEC